MGPIQGDPARKPSEASRRAASWASSAPDLSLPKGGGAIRGLGETFRAVPNTGSATFEIPVWTSPGRSGFFPKLSLNYDSAAGNGPFGIGWTLSVPRIGRRTDKALPQYDDQRDSDTFVLSGAEDLVTALRRDGSLDEFRRSVNGRPVVVRRYRPRVEADYQRIERWTAAEQPFDSHWRVTTRDNVCHVFGTDPDSRISDPRDPNSGRVFAWLLHESFDDRGHLIRYEYKPEDLSNVTRQLHETSRTVETIGANRYLKRIKYAFDRPYWPLEGKANSPVSWHCEVVFDYGEHVGDRPTPVEGAAWPCRQDAFSSYRSGFEIRTYRRCQRVLVFHRFPQLVPNPALVRATELNYGSERPDHAFSSCYMTQVTQRGFIWTGAGYQATSLPPVQFRYVEPVLESFPIRELPDVENLPVGVDDAQYRWVDLDGEGVPGVLATGRDDLYYRRGDPKYPDAGAPLAAFRPIEAVSPAPLAAKRLAAGSSRLLDVDGSGRLALLDPDPALGGFSQRDEFSWTPFKHLDQLPNLDWRDPNLKVLDVDADGMADLLIARDGGFIVHRSLGVRGFSSGNFVPWAATEEMGPRLVFHDSTESVFTADFSGDGLQDIVRIRRSEVCYWPNLGYGRFGAKITMSDAPRLGGGEEGDFDARRVRLIDFDGSGALDLIYLGAKRATLYLNHFGNRWGAGVVLTSFPAVSRLDTITTADLLGNGTGCLVWSSPLPSNQGRALRYIDPSGGRKPHLLREMDNNLGSVTSIEYAPSTKFYLADRDKRETWLTRLPFPVQVVERVTTADGPSNSRLTIRYAYHHGYFDGAEREFNGFGRVEQWDAESLPPASTGTPANSQAASDVHLPPVRIVRWFHTGNCRSSAATAKHFESEYWRGDGNAQLLPDTQLPSGLTSAEYREAVRALKGRLLREEIYSDDVPHGAPPEIAKVPYSTVEHAFAIRLLQPRASNEHAVIQVYPTEELAYLYERKAGDPRVTHKIMSSDEFGGLIADATIGYPRRSVPERRKEQEALFVRHTTTAFANETGHDEWYRARVPYETRTVEITGLRPEGSVFTQDEYLAKVGAIPSADVLPFDESPVAGRAQQRVVQHERTFFRQDNLAGDLPAGSIGSRAIPAERYQLAWTPGLLEGLFGARLAVDEIETRGGYKRLDRSYWLPSGRTFFSDANGGSNPPAGELAAAQRGFFTVRCYQDPFGARTLLHYDPFDILVEKTTDAVGNERRATNHYRTLRPQILADPNGNRTAVRLDGLGRVVATFSLGKESEDLGDRFDAATSEATQQDLPSSRLLYELGAWHQSQQPVYWELRRREQHRSANETLVTRTFLDGLGREIQVKKLADPDSAGHERWASTGRTVFDNKGNVVRKYEPFYDDNGLFNVEQGLAAKSTVTPLLRYDPLGRLIRTDFPNGTLARLDFDSWTEFRWDENDTVLESQWYLDRGSPDPAGSEPRDLEKRAAWLAAQHAGTPTQLHYDALGRHVATVEDLGAAAQGLPRYLDTRYLYDIEGNLLGVVDALDRTAQLVAYDGAGRMVRVRHMDSGERLTMLTASGTPWFKWDSRGHRLEYQYDRLQRLSNVQLIEPSGGAAKLVERLLYGDDVTQLAADDIGRAGSGSDAAANLNLRGRLYRHYDTAGLLANEIYDFKGNLARSSRRLTVDYKTTPDWVSVGGLRDLDRADQATATLLEKPWQTTLETFDALNRSTEAKNPFGGTLKTGFNRLELVGSLSHAAPNGETASVKNFVYNARGQKLGHTLGNGVVVSSTYDPKTFRLLTIESQGKTRKLQDLSYSYDPKGNISDIRDRGDVHDGSADSQYEYDAIYRLTKATGREHLGQSGNTLKAPVPPEVIDWVAATQGHPNDPKAMGRYTERYAYDAAGNILRVVHQAPSGGWTRWYEYKEASSNDGSQTCNRLSATSLPGDPAGGPYSGRVHHDANGNTTQLTNLPLLRWDYLDRLVASSKQVVANGNSPETTYYSYSAPGDRVRKVTLAGAGRGRSGSALRECTFFTNCERIISGPRLAQRKLTTLKLELSGVSFGNLEQANQVGATSTQPSYHFTNHVFSVVLVVESNETERLYTVFAPFGTTNYLRRASKSLCLIRFTGRSRDEETGLDYFGARYYDPQRARFASPDFASESPGSLFERDDPRTVNQYAYTLDNPLAYIDRDGHIATFVVGALVGAGLDIAVQTIGDEPFSVKQVIFSAGLGALGAGIAPKIAALPRLARIASVGYDIAESAAGQAFKIATGSQKEVKGTEIGAAVVAGRVGTFIGSKAVHWTTSVWQPTVTRLEREAARYERVAEQAVRAGRQRIQAALSVQRSAEARSIIDKIEMIGNKPSAKVTEWFTQQTIDPPQDKKRVHAP